MRDNAIVQFIILILSVKAGLLLLQYAAGFLPSAGPLGAVKVVLAK
jgi:hypothetical protein